MTIVYFHHSVAKSIAVCLQDTTWGYALLTTGLTLQAVVIVYGIHKFRTVLINEYGTREWYVPRAWSWMVKYVHTLQIRWKYIVPSSFVYNSFMVGTGSPHHQKKRKELN